MPMRRSRKAVQAAVSTKTVKNFKANWDEDWHNRVVKGKSKVSKAYKAAGKEDQQFLRSVMYQTSKAKFLSARAKPHRISGGLKSAAKNPWIRHIREVHREQPNLKPPALAKAAARTYSYPMGKVNHYRSGLGRSEAGKVAYRKGHNNWLTHYTSYVKTHKSQLAGKSGPQMAKAAKSSYSPPGRRAKLKVVKREPVYRKPPTVRLSTR